MASSLDSAKNAVKSFLSKDGKHDTTVHTSTNAAVVDETVDKHRHDNVIKATDREVHQDHYHTTVQPVHDTQTLKEQQHFRTAPVEERKFEHGNDAEVQQRLRAEQDKFHDTTREGATKHTTSTGGNLTSEHVHHHVHENIQPVIHRQTVEPHVVHTTIPVHETHHSAAKHHATSELPPVSLEEFKSQGGSLGGHKTKEEFFKGEPQHGAGHRAHNDADASDRFRETGHVDQHGAGGLSGSHHTSTTGTAGAVGTGLTGSHHTGTTGTTGITGATDTGLTGSHRTGTTGTTGTAGSGLTGTHHDATRGSDVTGSHHTGTTSATTGTGVGASSTDHATGTKPKLIDRLNPLKDADHDGKKGFLD